MRKQGRPRRGLELASGNLATKVEPWIHNAVKVRAVAEGVTVSHLLRKIILEYLSK